MLVVRALRYRDADLVESREATYSRPLAYLGFTKESVQINGQVQRVAPRLKRTSKQNIVVGGLAGAYALFGGDGSVLEGRGPTQGPGPGGQ